MYGRSDAHSCLTGQSTTCAITETAHFWNTYGSPHFTICYYCCRGLNFHSERKVTLVRGGRTACAVSRQHAHSGAAAYDASSWLPSIACSNLKSTSVTNVKQTPVRTPTEFARRSNRQALPQRLHPAPLTTSNRRAKGVCKGRTPTAPLNPFGVV